MNVEEELTALERRLARGAVLVAESSWWLSAFLPALNLLNGVLSAIWAHRLLATDPATAAWSAGIAGMLIAIGIFLLLDYPLVRALGVLYRRAGGAGELPPAMRAPGPSSGARLPLRAACLVAFASGLLACGVALWRFGSGEMAPAWAGIAMAAAGGFGAGAALIASFLPRWMERVAQLEARSGESAKD
jgi:hypothetical protein